MKCTIPGKGIKAFGRAILCLSKIGEELYFEATSNGLSLRTVNSGRSAYACFTFCPTFFHHYDDGRSQLNNATCTSSSQTITVKCKVPIKSCLSVFRSTSNMEKSVDHCVINLDLSENKLVFVLHCRYGIVKTYDLSFEECQSLQAVFNKQLSPNCIIGPAKTISDVVTNFATSLEEVSLIVTPDKLRIKSYYEEEKEMTRMAATTEISLDPPEFDEYTIGVDTEITFCLKELRAVLSFTDSIPQQLTISFEQASQPVIFSFDAPQEYSADFVMATLATTSTGDITTAHQRTTTRPSAAATALTTSARPSVSNGRPPAVSINKQQLSTDHCDIAATPPAAISIAETPNKDINPVSWLQEGTVSVEGTNGHHNEEPVTVSSSKPTEEDKKELLPHSHDRETDNLLDSLFDDIINDDIADNEYGFTHQHPSSTGVPSKGSSNSTDKTKQQLTFSQSEFPHSPVAMDTGDITSGCIILPPTPPTKKFKSHFYNQHMDSAVFQDTHTILAPDSDEEVP